MNAFLITGDTYKNRRALRAVGGLFDRSEMGYIIRAENTKAKELAESLGLTVEPFDATEEQLTPATGERLREIRQDHINRRRERLLFRADAADRRADKISQKITPYEKEFLRLCEPVKIGHHSERRHRKLIKRAQDAFFAEGEERLKARRLRDKAAWCVSAQVKGDAERRRAEAREVNRGKFAIGDVVECIIYGIGTVTRINKQSLSVAHSTRGFVFKVDIGRAKLVAKGNGSVPAPKFKAGDKVIASRLLAKYEGVIKRRTSRGYSVEFVSFGRTRVETFAECDIVLRT